MARAKKKKKEKKKAPPPPPVADELDVWTIFEGRRVLTAYGLSLGLKDSNAARFGTVSGTTK